MDGGFRAVGRVLAVAALLGLSFSPASGQTLTEALEGLIQKHKRLIAAQADADAARENVEVAWGNWYPTLDINAHKGYEVDKKDGGRPDTHLPAERADAMITQRLYDFGRNNAIIDRAVFTQQQTEATLQSTRQSLLQEGVIAYLEVMRNSRLVKFAESSESNIKRQTDLEDARVQRGSGFSTDVLQSKSQLAGVQARRVRSEGQLQQAMNRYRGVFYTDVLNPDAMAQPRTPLDMVPTSLEEAIEVALRSNPELRAAQLAAEAARTDITRTRAASYYPTIDAVAEHEYQKDNAGDIGAEHDSIIKLQLRYQFNLGMTATNSLKASEQTFTATEQRYMDTRHKVEEQTRNAWNDLQTAQINAEFLRNQANITAEFLELARKERQLGRRSLIDVLSGETSLINANSDAASAETDVAIAVYKLLAATGKLELGAIR
jgi:TolC family type I secretion outer membrane protein